jgi:sulfur dioxygenase
MIFHQLFDIETSTFTYLLGCQSTLEAVLIDPVESEVETYYKLLNMLGLRLVYTLETHVHADHVTAADTLRKTLGSQTVLHKDSGVACADVLVEDESHLSVGTMEIVVKHTPGHTNGCVSYLVGNMIFTGDALLIDGCGRTDFQMGNAKQLYESIHQKIFSLPDDTLVYPGHDYNGKISSTVLNEKKNNKRLNKSITQEKFLKIMSDLNLDYPKKIDTALPANLNCGQTNTIA